MNAIVALASKDIRIIYRDRFLAFVALYALALALVARALVGWIPWESAAIYLAPAIVLFGTILLGTLLGFALVEEREQGTWLLLRVLPLGATTLFLYLVVVASVSSFVVSAAAAHLYGYPVADRPAFFVMLAASALCAPLVMMIIGSLAANKIEGLAMSKIVSAAGVLPSLVFVLPAPWQLLLAWCPLYWLYLGLLEAYAGNPSKLSAVHWPGYPWWLCALAAVALSALGTALTTRLYLRRAV